MHHVIKKLKKMFGYSYCENNTVIILSREKHEKIKHQVIQQLVTICIILRCYKL